MGAINCCVDTSAVDEYAHESCVLPEDVEPVGIISQGQTSQIKQGNQDVDDARTSSSSSSSGCGLQELMPQIPTTTELGEESIKKQRRTRRQRQPTQKKLTERQPSYSLFQVTAKTSIRLSDYLCPCDPCPHSQRINRLLDSVFGCPQDPTSTGAHENDQDRFSSRIAIHRVLRGCATFDERKELDEAIVLFVKDLLMSLHGDEDQAFRQLLAHKYQQAPAMRRGSAVTA